MNLSVPKVPQSRVRAQRNHSVWALQKRNLNVPPFSDILGNCVLSNLWQVWWGIFIFQHEYMRYIKKLFIESGVAELDWPTQNLDLNTFGKNWKLTDALVSEWKQNPCIHVKYWKSFPRSLLLERTNCLLNEQCVIIYSPSWHSKLVEHKDILKTDSAVFVNIKSMGPKT